MPPPSRSVPPLTHLRLRSRFTGARPFSSTRSCPLARLYQPIRRPEELDTLLLSSASSRTALITLWTASWCRTCPTVLPAVRDAVEAYGDSKEGLDVGFVEVEFDTPGNEEAGGRYLITSIPTLLSFSRQEAQMNTRVTDPKMLADRAFLSEWIAREAERGGEGGAGGEGLLGKVIAILRGGG